MQRLVLQDRFYLGLSLKETAYYLDLTEGAVKSLQWRACEHLKKARAVESVSDQRRAC